MRVGEPTAEKALKALLILRDIDPPKLHDLDRLAQRLPDDEGGAFATIELPELTRWVIEGDVRPISMKPPIPMP